MTGTSTDPLMGVGPRLLVLWRCRAGHAAHREVPANSASCLSIATNPRPQSLRDGCG